MTVSDQGKGPTNPFVGLVPTSDTDSAGMGLWVTHQLCNHVTFETGAHGYTLRLVLGDPFGPVTCQWPRRRHLRCRRGLRLGSGERGGVDDEPVPDVGGEDALVGLVDLAGG